MGSAYQTQKASSSRTANSTQSLIRVHHQFMCLTLYLNLSCVRFSIRQALSNTKSRTGQFSLIKSALKNYLTFTSCSKECGLQLNEMTMLSISRAIPVTTALISHLQILRVQSQMQFQSAFFFLARETYLSCRLVCHSTSATTAFMTTRKAGQVLHPIAFLTRCLQLGLTHQQRSLETLMIRRSSSSISKRLQNKRGKSERKKVIQEITRAKEISKISPKSSLTWSFGWVSALLLLCSFFS